MDKELEDALKACGMKSARAQCIAALANNDELLSKEIQAATGLPQPVISKVTNWLTEQGWAESHKANGQGRGARAKVWNLKGGAARVIHEASLQFLEELNEHEVAVERLLQIKRRYEE
jgi:predicted transcriptional regulator